MKKSREQLIDEFVDRWGHIVYAQPSCEQEWEYAHDECRKDVEELILAAPPVSLAVHPINADGLMNKAVSYCYKCGKTIRVKNQKFCHNCGRKLDWGLDK